MLSRLNHFFVRCTMRVRSTLIVAAIFAAGGALGWLAADSRLDFNPQVHASNLAASPIAQTGSTERQPGTIGIGQPPQAGKKPNILVIMGDDIGWSNPSCYHRGDMRYQTPNIDRIAREGAMFTSWYGQNSCTAGRA